MASCFGLEVEVISPAEAQELYPIMSIDGLVGAVYLPRDGQTNPTDTTQALARGARNKGVRIFEQTRVNALEKKIWSDHSCDHRQGPYRLRDCCELCGYVGSGKSGRCAEFLCRFTRRSISIL